MSPISSTLANASAYGYRTLAAAAAGAYESIATITTSGVVGAVSFGPGISQTYASLQLRISARSNSSGTGNSALYVNFGGSSTSYAYHALNGDGSSATASGTASTSDAYLGLIPNNGNTSGIFGTIIIDIHDYASTTKFKTVRAFGGFDTNGTGNARLTSALWQSTTAIGSGGNYIDIFAVGGFIADSTFALYGIKGA
jgi:hypothetical protein